MPWSTVIGACLGTSTVTASVESTAGVASGGRTGLTSVVTAAMFVGALFVYPIVRMIGGGYVVGPLTLYPTVAPALVLVGVLMMEGVTHIAWTDLTEAIPAFLAIVVMPLAVSITDGLAFGFISMAILKVATGRGRELDPVTYVHLRGAVCPQVCRLTHCRGPMQRRCPMPLITPAELSAALKSPTPPVVIDTRPAEQFAEGHIPTATHFDVWGLSLIDTSEAPLRAFMWMIGHILSYRGVTPERQVVVYEADSGMRAARAYWFLDALGHPAPRLLDGGSDAWRAAGLALTTEVHLPKQSAWHGSLDLSKVAMWQEVAAGLGAAGRRDPRHAER